LEETGARADGFGERLRRERELRGISLDEIAAATKIGTRLLRALEAEQFDLLPGGIFNKGYVRAYARHLGLNEEKAVADYLRAANEAPPDVRLIAHQNASLHSDGNREVTGSAISPRGFNLLPVFILLAVIAGAAGGWRLYQQRHQERHQTASMSALPAGQPSIAQTAPRPNTAPDGLATSPPTSDSAGVSSAPSAATGPADKAVDAVGAADSPPRSSDVVPEESGAGGGTPFEVTVRAKDHARVEIKSDGKVALRGVMNPADVKTVRATDKIVFWTANAGDVEVSFNGKSVPLSHGQNDEQVLVFNSRGLRRLPDTP